MLRMVGGEERFAGKGKLFGKSFPFPEPLPFQKLWVEGRKEGLRRIFQHFSKSKTLRTYYIVVVKNIEMVKMP